MGEEGPTEPPAKQPKFLKKAERAACWEARDGLWACWDKGDPGACDALREVFKGRCPAAWVTHFDRKYEYEKFKKRLYSEGQESVDGSFAKGAKR
jgi:hypothetical protein